MSSFELTVLIFAFFVVIVSKMFNGVTFCFCRKDNVLRLWQYLLELLRARQLRLDLSLQLQRVFEEMMCTLEWMDEIKVCVVNLGVISLVWCFRCYLHHE